MMKMHYHYIVLGLGIVGSSCLYQLSRRGAQVLGIEQFQTPHPWGSSHGESRLYRQAIGEGDQYVPLALRSGEIWREIEKIAQRSLLIKTGGLIIANHEQPLGSHFFTTTLTAAKKYHIQHEVLTAAVLKQKFPQFIFSKNDYGYFEYNMGYLLAEQCLTTLQKLALSHAANIMNHNPIIAIEHDTAKPITLITNNGKITCDQLLVCSGSWVTDLLADNYKKFFNVYRQTLYWFDTAENYTDFTVPHFPCFIREFGNGSIFYGFPAMKGVNGGIKLATDRYDRKTTLNSLNRTVEANEIQQFYREYVQPSLKQVNANCLKAETCLYTTYQSSEGERFLIDQDQQDPRIFWVAPCAGHGFKHAAAIAETCVDWVMQGERPDILRHFSWQA